MQVENKQTVTTDKLNFDHDPLQFACHPLGKLEFFAGTITSLCDLAGEPFGQNRMSLTPTQPWFSVMASLRGDLY